MAADSPRIEPTGTLEPSDPTLSVLDDPLVEAFGMLEESHNELAAETTRRMDDSFDAPLQWFEVFLRLARSPGARLRMSQLARDMTMSTSGLTRLIDRLEEAGHVRREACPEDRRGMWAVLQPSGRALLAQVAPGHVDDLRELLGEALDPVQLRQLTDLLRIVRDHVRQLPAG